MSGVVFVAYLPATSILGAGLTAIKLLKTGLYRRYPAFFAYLLVFILSFAAPFFGKTKSDA
jgi:hypothetical protein